MTEKITHEEFMDRAYDEEPDPQNATILFSMWYNNEGKKPEDLGPEYEDLRDSYAKWLKARGYE